MGYWSRVAGNVLGIAILALFAGCEATEQPPEAMGRASAAVSDCAWVELVASRQYNPVVVHPDEENFSSPINLRIPAELEVITGNAGTGTVNLNFYLGAVLNRCFYRGSTNGTRYSFHSCYNGSPGKLALADRVVLAVGGGLASAGTTTVRVVLEEPLDDGTACTVDSCDPVSGVTHSPLIADDEDPRTIQVCDPATGLHTWTAPDVDPSATTTIRDAWSFLYTGPDPLQTGVDPNDIDLRAAALITGYVHKPDGSAKPLAAVAVLGHPEFGSTITDHSGRYIMVVNGGGPLTIDVEAEGFLRAQRQVTPGWQRTVRADDIRLVEPAGIAGVVDLDTQTEIEVVEGALVTDDRGSRQLTMLVQPGTEATKVYADGTTAPLDTLTFRLTEYTVGPNGPAQMPAALPPTSGYTYAIEVGIEEAADADGVTLSSPVHTYLDNFLDLPVGTIVPVGRYDRRRGLWVPEEDGLIIGIVSTAGGVAVLDLNGDGVAELEADHEAAGFDPATREELAALYTAGTELWHARLDHFSPIDLNFAFGPPEDACSGGECVTPGFPEDDPESCQASGSVIECANQVLGEDVPISGTPHKLSYRSSRVPGRLWPNRRISLPLTQSVVPSSAVRVRATVAVAGRVFEESIECPCAPNQSWDFTWDGKDGLGRIVQGAQLATFSLTYYYEPLYLAAPGPGGGGGGNGNPSAVLNSPSYAFGRWGQQALSDGSGLIGLSSSWNFLLGNWDARAAGLGGFTFDAVHHLDVNSSTLYYGDGERRIVEPNELTVRKQRVGTAAQHLLVRRDGSVLIHEITALSIPHVYERRRDGSEVTILGCTSLPCAYDLVDVPAAGVNPAGGVTDIAEGPDGSLYFSTGTANKIRRIDPQGILRAFAGDGAAASDGDGGPATAASLNMPGPVAVGADGSVYVAEIASGRLRRIDAGGTITTVAGQTPGPGTGWNGPASNAALGQVKDLQVHQDGSVYLLYDYFGFHFLAQIDVSGTFRRVAGSSGGSDAAEGVPATDALLGSNTKAFTFGPDGTIDVLTQQNFGGANGSAPITVVRRITQDGIIRTIAGKPYDFTLGAFGFNGPAADAGLSGLTSLAASPDGRVYLGLANGIDANDLIRVERYLPGLEDDNTQLIASEDGQEIYVFDQMGRHRETRDALRNTVLLTIAWVSEPMGAPDAELRIASLTDENGRVTTVERNPQGEPTAIIGPFGHRTELMVNADGYLDRIEDPLGEAYEIAWYPGGLMQSWTNRNGNTTTFAWDADGRLVGHTNAGGGYMTLTPTQLAGGLSVTRTTPLGRATTYTFTTDGAETVTRSTELPNGLTATRVQTRREQGTITLPDGTTTVTQLYGDPRFAMQSPLTSSTITLPSGLERVVSLAREVTLSDPNDRLSLVSSIDTVSVNDKTWTREYTAATRTEVLASPEGRQTTAAYDAQARLTQVSIPGDFPISLAYDTQGRLLTTSQGTRVTTHGYGADGLLATLTDPLIQQTALARNARGDVTTVTRPDLEQTLFGYDGEQQTSSVAPPGKPAHGLGYGVFDSLVTYDPPDLTSGPVPTTYTYDLDKNPSTVLQPGPRLVEYGYDGAGWLYRVDFPGGTIFHNYSATTGHLEQLLGPYGVDLAFTYDGPLVTSASWSGAVTGSILWDYNADFALVSERIDGVPVAFDYDLDGLLVGAGGLVLTRDPANGRVVSVTSGAVSQTLDYSEYGELESSFAAINASQALDFSYARDDLGRITEKTETNHKGTSTVFGYSYDAAGRLTEVTKDGNVVESYAYDANGNRTSSSNDAGSFAATFDYQDRLLTYGSLAFTWTLNGEIETKTDTSTTDVTSYSYDALGNLIGVTLPNGDELEYVVDGVGRRVGKRVNDGVTKKWLWRSELQLVAELDKNDNIVQRYVYVGSVNVPAQIITATATYRLIKDDLGSVRLVIDEATGDVVQELQYDAWGRVVMDTNRGFQPFGFAGGLYDPDTGLVRFGARDYDPEIGRWTAKDPIRFDGGVNLYAYTENDPVNYVDSTGENRFMSCQEQCLALASGAAVGVAQSPAGSRAAQTCAAVAPRFAQVVGPRMPSLPSLAAGGVQRLAARFDPARAGHIFREAAGHVNPASAGSQARFARLFEEVASNPANLRADAVQAGLITQHAADAGVQAFSWTGRTGQVWVTVRNGLIQNAGVNPLGVVR